MIQIGTVVIGHPPIPSKKEMERFVHESNQRRLKCMNDFGIDITIDELTEEKWRNFYTNTYKQEKHEEILICRGEKK